jgi:predicted acetyltransferase
MCSINDSTSVIYRSVKKHDQDESLDLWYSVFGADDPGCFERDFTIEASPNYQEGDTIGAWYNGQLISAIHIRRIILQSGGDGMKYLCGGISNVATLEKYRNQGFSRHLLRLAIERMEQSGEFDLSILGTGRPNHYSVLGWEKIIDVPNTVNIEWKNFDVSINNIEWCSASEIFTSDRELILALYTRNSRTYQFDRSPSTIFEHWVGWNWRLHQAIIYIYREKESGYVVIGKPNHANDIYVSEWRASNADVEKKLLQIAAAEIYRRQQQQTNIVRLHGLPQYITVNQLEQWAGKIKIEPNEDMMIRNIRLPNQIIDEIKTDYSKGSATFWPGDSF